MRERSKRGISEREDWSQRSACGVRGKEKPRGDGLGALGGSPRSHHRWRSSIERMSQRPEASAVAINVALALGESRLLALASNLS